MKWGIGYAIFIHSQLCSDWGIKISVCRKFQRERERENVSLTFWIPSSAITEADCHEPAFWFATINNKLTSRKQHCGLCSVCLIFKLYAQANHGFETDGFWTSDAVHACFWLLLHGLKMSFAFSLSLSVWFFLLLRDSKPSNQDCHQTVMWLMVQDK